MLQYHPIHIRQAEDLQWQGRATPSPHATCPRPHPPAPSCPPLVSWLLHNKRDCVVNHFCSPLGGLCQSMLSVQHHDTVFFSGVKDRSTTKSHFFCSYIRIGIHGYVYIVCLPKVSTRFSGCLGALQPSLIICSCESRLMRMSVQHKMHKQCVGAGKEASTRSLHQSPDRPFTTVLHHCSMGARVQNHIHICKQLVCLPQVSGPTSGLLRAIGSS